MLDSDDEIANYFRSNLLICRKAIDPADFKKFAALETNGERVAFILSYPEAHCLPLEIQDYPAKDLNKALRLKENGNKFYGNGNYHKALETYSNAILITPNKDLGIFLANRSAALYNLGHHKLALIDANEAQRFGYPQELLYKLEERCAKSYLALKNNAKAIEKFRSTLQALDFAKITVEKKKKIESDIRVMLAVMEKGKQLNEQQSKKNNIIQECAVNSLQNEESILPKITDYNPVYPSCSTAVEIRDGGGAIGRHGIATRDVMPGELLIVDKPHSVIMLGEYRLRNCQYCFRKNIAPYPAVCDTCTIIAYCSPRCRDADAKVHISECNILAPLWLSNASVTCLMAIKAVIQKPWIKLKPLIEDFKKSKGIYKFTIESPFKGTDYPAYWSMVTHESERTAEDLFHRAYIAAWLLRILKTTSYLPNDAKTPDVAEECLTEDEFLIADILLHHLQLLQFNTHEISELEMPRGATTLAKAKSNFIGGGLYPTAALLNHSCNPGVVRYFVGTTMVVRAIRTIRAGNEICDNYGPTFTTVDIKERKRKLRLQYWFECGCEACTENWPLLSDLDPRILRFRCETGATCGNILLVNTDSNEFMAMCNKCGKSTNIMKGLKILQDTDCMMKKASKHLESGENSEARKTYMEILKLLDDTLALPIRDYYLCQQGVRLTILPLGNIAYV